MRDCRDVLRALALAALVSLTSVHESRAQTSSLPPPWSAQDIGNPSQPGSASADPGAPNGDALTITATGVDIWGTSDQFHFAYQQVSGDFEILARVDDVTPADAWSKAGVMIRASLAPDAAHAFALVSASKGVAFQRRRSTGAASIHSSGGLLAAPYWVRLVRQASRVVAYTSADGANWTTIASDTISLPQTAYVGIAVTSHDAAVSTTANVSQIALNRFSLPAPQQHQDIGTPAVPGNVSFQSGTYTMSAGGIDVWGASDQFHFVYQPVTGDVDMVVRVASLSGPSAWSKAGLMVRETLTADSAHAFALVSIGKGYAFQRRAAAGGLSDHTSGMMATAPAWLRLVRAGALFSAYQSADGQNWTAISTATIPMADAVYVGIALTAHASTGTAVASFDHFALTQAAPPPNQPPTVSLTAPADGAAYTAPGSMDITADARDSDGQIGRVEFYAKATLVGTVSAAPYSMTWMSVPAGTYVLTAVAFDNSGASTTSAGVSVTVAAPNQPPAVTLSSPGNGSTFTAPATISLAASASDPDGTVARVEFYNGATLLASVGASPYQFTWSSVPAGTYTLTAVAVDNSSAQTRSAGVTVTVSAPPPPPPPPGLPRAIVFQESADGTLVTSYKLDIFLAGADPATATPILSVNLGKPAPDANGDITSDQSALFTALLAGNYIATVSAMGSNGSSRSAPATFTR